MPRDSPRRYPSVWRSSASPWPRRKQSSSRSAGDTGRPSRAERNPSTSWDSGTIWGGTGTAAWLWSGFPARRVFGNSCATSRDGYASTSTTDHGSSNVCWRKSYGVSTSTLRSGTRPTSYGPCNARCIDTGTGHSDDGARRRSGHGRNGWRDRGSPCRTRRSCTGRCEGEGSGSPVREIRTPGSTGGGGASVMPAW